MQWKSVPPQPETCNVNQEHGQPELNWESDSDEGEEREESTEEALKLLSWQTQLKPTLRTLQDVYRVHIWSGYKAYPKIHRASRYLIDSDSFCTVGKVLYLALIDSN